jgi:hypothetical protein
VVAAATECRPNLLLSRREEAAYVGLSGDRGIEVRALQSLCDVRAETSTSSEYAPGPRSESARDHSRDRYRFAVCAHLRRVAPATWEITPVADTDSKPSRYL